MSSVSATLLRDALRNSDQSVQRGAKILAMWQKAFAPLTEEEMMLVDGIILEELETASK